MENVVYLIIAQYMILLTVQIIAKFVKRENVYLAFLDIQLTIRIKPNAGNVITIVPVVFQTARNAIFVLNPIILIVRYY